MSVLCGATYNVQDKPKMITIILKLKVDYEVKVLIALEINKKTCVTSIKVSFYFVNIAEVLPVIGNYSVRKRCIACRQIIILRVCCFLDIIVNIRCPKVVLIFFIYNNLVQVLHGLKNTIYPNCFKFFFIKFT